MQKLRGRIARLRDVAARTVPFEPKSKKKTPPEIMDALEAIVRPFYMESEAGPNTNKCKKAIWTLLFPILAPWVAETTTKTKVQNINSRLCGSLELDKDKLRSVARACGSLSPAVCVVRRGAVGRCSGTHARRLSRVLPCRAVVSTALHMFLAPKTSRAPWARFMPLEAVFITFSGSMVHTTAHAVGAGFPKSNLTTDVRACRHPGLPCHIHCNDTRRGSVPRAVASERSSRDDHRHTRMQRSRRS